MTTNLEDLQVRRFNEKLGMPVYHKATVGMLVEALLEQGAPTKHAVLAWIEEPYEEVDGTIMPLSVIQILRGELEREAE